jgi:hypothetical protein
LAERLREDEESIGGNEHATDRDRARGDRPRTMTLDRTGADSAAVRRENATGARGNT